MKHVGHNSLVVKRTISISLCRSGLEILEITSNMEESLSILLSIIRWAATAIVSQIKVLLGGKS